MPKPAPVNDTDKPWITPTREMREASERQVEKPRPGVVTSTDPRANLSVTAYDPDHVYFDTPGDGNVWAAGNTYKACFSPTSFTYVPFLGSDAPKNYPLQLELASVKVGNRELTWNRSVTPVRTGERIVYDRGSVQEIYDLTARGIEQSFKVVETDAAGEVRVELRVVSELVEDTTRAGLQFNTALGGVNYGDAFVVHGNSKQEITSRYANQRIELVVAEAQRAGLGAPVTIDPILTSWNITNASTYAYIRSDVAYDVTNDRYMVCWERSFSATDHDVMAELRTTLGAAIAGSTDFIDVSTVYWSKPRIANLNQYDRCLVACEVDVAGVTTIQGRVRNMVVPIVQSVQFLISGAEIGNKTDPDVGGDPSTAPPTYWFVVYRRVFSATDTDVHGRRVGWDATLNVPILPTTTVLIDDTSGTIDFAPSISKSDGSVGAGSQDWMVAYSRQFSATDTDVRGAAIHWDGSITTANFSVNGSTLDDIGAQVSSPTDFNSANMSYLYVWRRNNATDDDIMGQLMRKTGVTQIGTTNISTLHGAPAVDQFQPTVDSDGCRFLVVYWEGTPGYAVPIHIQGANLGASDARVALTAAGNFIDAQLCSDHSGGGLAPWYSIVNTDLNSSPTTIRGTIFGGYGPGGFTTVRPGCGGLGMTTGGRPFIGESISFTLTGVGSDIRALILGLPGAGLTICPGCVLGVNLGLPTIVLSGTSVANLPIPCEGTFVGVTLAMQGVAFGSGPCTAFGNLRTGPEIDFKIQ